MSATAYPLQWPEGWKRTPGHQRQRARYKLPNEVATRHLLDELRRLGAHRESLVVSTNIVLRNDGLPYVNQPKYATEDPGVAVYWSTRSFKDRVIACDKWDSVYDNIHAIGLAVEGMRAIERAGASQVLERAFTAFGALPPAASAPVERPWWEVLGMPKEALSFATLTMVEAQYRETARKAHPDQGGSAGAMVELNRAIDQARKHFRGSP
jgi:hypothetical protein